MPDGNGYYNTVDVGSKPCWEVINGLSDISDKEKDLMKAELPGHYMCPDTNSYILDGALTDFSY